MMFKTFILSSVVILACTACIFAMDLAGVPTDLVLPSVTDQAPAPGRRVRQFNTNYAGTGVYHPLYLPTDWQKGKHYPVIVEYAGNKWKESSAGTVEGSKLGYGISAGRGVIWICMPFVDKKNLTSTGTWWGDVDATVDYCKQTVRRICAEYGGDSSNVFLAGFSRGAIACNYIGLHDDEIASLWRGFICHSHYDGVRQWSYAASDRKSAAERLKRLGSRPQFISQETSVETTKVYLSEVYPSGNFTFQPLPFGDHTDIWVLRDIPERKALREWLNKSLKSNGVLLGKLYTNALQTAAHDVRFNIALIKRCDYMKMNRISNCLVKLQENPEDKALRSRLDELSKDVEFSNTLTLRLRSNGSTIKYTLEPIPTTMTEHIDKNQVTLTFASPPFKFGYPFVHVEARIACGNGLNSEMPLTKTEPFTEPTAHWPAHDSYVTHVLTDILPAKTNSLVGAERIIDWIRFQKHIVPDTKTEGNRGTRYGAVEVLKQGFGNCWDYSDAFITLCRAAGIPSRQVAGWRSGRGGHIWAEIYLEHFGWIQVDPTTGLTATDDYVAYFTTPSGDMPIVYMTWPRTKKTNE